MLQCFVLVLLLSLRVVGHYIFPRLVVNGVGTEEWKYVRKTDNYLDFNPLEDVASPNLRCFDSRRNLSEPVETYDVPAGARIGFGTGLDGWQVIFHQSVTNVYMAKVPEGLQTHEWEGDGEVWFKVHEIPAMCDGVNYIWFPSQGLQVVEFTLPHALPPGQYLVRIENIALHYAMNFGGAQFYGSCAQINVLPSPTGTKEEGPSRSESYEPPGPLVAIPGLYDGREPGILININHPIPTVYFQPGPPVWNGY